jgi:hypothetical protein
MEDNLLIIQLYWANKNMVDKEGTVVLMFMYA